MIELIDGKIFAKGEIYNIYKILHYCVVANDVYEEEYKEEYKIAIPVSKVFITGNNSDVFYEDFDGNFGEVDTPTGNGDVVYQFKDKSECQLFASCFNVVEQNRIKSKEIVNDFPCDIESETVLDQFKR